jgi:hypothetical protein
MSVKRSDLVKYFEENGFYLLREEIILFTQMISKRFRLRDIGQLIALLRMQYVSKQ